MPKLKNFKLQLLIAFSKEDKYIVAYCPALNLSGYGYTEVQAKSSFEQNLEIFFEETSAKGTLEKVLLDLGWTIRKKPQALYEQPCLDVNFLSKYKNLENVNFKSEVVQIPVYN